MDRKVLKALEEPKREESGDQDNFYMSINSKAKIMHIIVKPI